MDLRSPLKKVKGLGAAKEGTHHWWMQRVTAVALIPLVVWFVLLVIKASVSAEQLMDYMRSPFHATAMLLFLGTILYHGNLGMKVILEDYVHCPCGKNVLTLLLHFVTIVTLVASVLAVANVHLGMAHMSLGRDSMKRGGMEMPMHKGYSPLGGEETKPHNEVPAVQE